MPSNSICSKHAARHLCRKFVVTVLNIPTAFIVSLPFLNPNLCSSSTPSIFFSALLNIFTVIYSACAMRLIMQWSWHFVAFGFPFKAIILISMITFSGQTLCRSFVSLVCDPLLPTVVVLPQVHHHHLLQPSYPLSGLNPFALRCARFKVRFGLYLFPLRVRLPGFSVD